MMSKSNLIHFVAHCHDCDWGTQNYTDGPKLASRHAMTKKHLVTADKGIYAEYNGRRKKEARP